MESTKYFDNNSGYNFGISNQREVLTVNLRTIIDRSVAILLQPQLYFTSDDDIMDFGDGAVYSALMGVLGALIGVTVGAQAHSGLSGLVSVVVIGPIITVLSVFIMAGIIYTLCRYLGGRGDYADSFHIAASATAIIPIAQLLAPLPLLVISMAWVWWIVSRGAIHIHKVQPGKAESALAVLYGGLTLLAVIWN